MILLASKDLIRVFIGLQGEQRDLQWLKEMIWKSNPAFVRASADQVYNAFTTAEGLDAWFTNFAKVEPRPGGEILFRWRDWEPDRVTGEDGGLFLKRSRRSNSRNETRSCSSRPSN